MKYSMEQLNSFSDEEIVKMLLEEKLSRNKYFDFFATERGKRLFRYAKLLKTIKEDISQGARCTELSLDTDDMVKVVVESTEEIYKRTVFLPRFVVDLASDFLPVEKLQ